MNLVFFGASKHVLPILDVLIKNYKLCLIITTESEKNEPVSSFANKFNIPLLSIKKFDQSNVQTIKSTKPTIGVLAYFGLILPKQVLNLFPKGILNLHPSLLPKYRGPTPVQTAILNGDKTTGVALIKLDEQTDHGPILSQIDEPILPDDTSESLYERLFKKSAKLLEKNLPLFLENKIKLQIQDDSKATFTQELTRQSGYFDINSPPSKEQLDRMIRAYHPWPGVWTQITTNPEQSTINLRIKFLPNQKLQVEGKKPISYKDFINGYPALAKRILPIIQ